MGGWGNVGNKAQTQPSLAGAWAELGKTRNSQKYPISDLFHGHPDLSDYLTVDGQYDYTASIQIFMKNTFLYPTVLKTMLLSVKFGPRLNPILNWETLCNS